MKFTKPDTVDELVPFKFNQIKSHVHFLWFECEKSSSQSNRIKMINFWDDIISFNDSVEDGNLVHGWNSLKKIKIVIKPDQISIYIKSSLTELNSTYNIMISFFFDLIIFTLKRDKNNSNNLWKFFKWSRKWASFEVDKKYRRMKSKIINIDPSILNIPIHMWT